MNELALSDARAASFTRLTQQLASLGVRVRLNRNRRTLLSLRQHASAGLVLSLHGDLLDHAAGLAEIPAWVRARGRLRCPCLREALALVFRSLHQRLLPPPLPDLPTLDGPLDVTQVLERVHGRWFAHLTKPAIDWARSSPRRRLRHIRFACYRRGVSPIILINPRLSQPWLAWVFIEHVIFHELCHHAQAAMPVRGESAHSRRFRDLERTYPHHAEALAWERANLHRLLDGHPHQVIA